MKRATLLLLSMVAMGGQDPLVWQLEGYPRLFEAATRARKEKKRLLLGLSGSPT